MISPQRVKLMRFLGGSSIFTLIGAADGINKNEGVGGGAGLIAGTLPFRDASGSISIHSFIHSSRTFFFSLFPALHNHHGRRRRHLVLDSGQLARRADRLTNSVLHDDRNNRLPSTQLAGELPPEAPSGRLAVCPGSNQSCWLRLPGHMTTGDIWEPFHSFFTYSFYCGPVI